MAILNRSRNRQLGGGRGSATRGAVVFNQQPIDYGRMFNAINARQNQVKAEQKEVSDKINAVRDFDQRTWDLQQRETDTMLEDLEKFTTEKLLTGPKRGVLGYADQSEINKKKRDIMDFVGQSNRAEKEYLQVQSQLKAPKANDVVDVAATNEAIQRRIYKTTNGEFNLDEEGNKVPRDPSEITMDGVYVYREKPQATFAAASTPRIHKTPKTVTEREGKRIDVKKFDVDKKGSVSNWLKKTPTKTTNNQWIADRDARDKGYDGWRDWQSKNPEEFTDHVFENYTTAVTGGPTTAVTALKDGITFGGWGAKEFTAGDYNAQPQTWNTAKGNVYSGAMTEAPITGKIQVPAKKSIVNLSTGERISLTGNIDADVSKVATLPRIKEGVTTENIVLEGAGYPAELINKIKSDIKGRDIQYSDTEIAKLKEVLGEDYDNFYSDDVYVIGTAIDETAKRKTAEGKTIGGKVAYDAAVLFDKAAQDSYKKALMAKNATEEQADQIISNMINLGQSKASQKETTASNTGGLY